MEGLLHSDDARENGLSCAVCSFLYIVIRMKVALSTRKRSEVSFILFQNEFMDDAFILSELCMAGLS